MKAVARSYLWWPHLDSDIEQMARNCHQCKLTASNPPVSPAHPWMVPQNAWECIHMDHAQWEKWLLLASDCKYIVKMAEVFVISTTSVSQMIDKLCTVFATHGLSVTLVSDNGPPFSSSAFKEFMDHNGIVHRWVPLITCLQTDWQRIW